MCSGCDASLIVHSSLALWTILRRYRWLYLRAYMTHALAPGPCIRFEPELYSVLLHAWLQSRHNQDKNPIAVRRIGQPAADRLGQADLTVIGTHGPLRDHRFGLISE